MKPLYVLTAIFNPRRFKSRIALYKNFAAWVASCGVQLLTVETAFGERPFEVTSPDNPWNLQLRTSSDIWHKEDALNLGVQKLCQLVPDWGYFAYLDADVKILRDDWATETVHLLQHYAIIQMFGEVETLDPSGHVLLRGRSICREWHDKGWLPGSHHPYPCGGWPGLGWGYRRREFEEIGGLIDICVSSSGDLHMAACYLGNPMWGMPPGASAGFKRYIQAYGDLCALYVKENVSYLPGLLVHYWHGKGKDRGHASRKAAIEKFAYDPYTDIMRDAQGLQKWRGNKIGLERAIRRSLEARNEDSIDV